MNASAIFSEKDRDQSHSDTLFYLQRANTDQFWSGAEWVDDVESARTFNELGAALTCALAMCKHELDLLIVFRKTNGRIVIPMG